MHWIIKTKQPNNMLRACEKLLEFVFQMKHQIQELEEYIQEYEVKIQVFFKALRCGYHMLAAKIQMIILWQQVRVFFAVP